MNTSHLQIQPPPFPPDPDAEARRRRMDAAIVAQLGSVTATLVARDQETMVRRAAMMLRERTPSEVLEVLAAWHGLYGEVAS